ncbi:trypsin-like peptidase domain-containing protein [Kitasatospora sp. NPDC056184]|uniref:effector-associated domain 2-containing protein n=1 Tax=Kitasatospora sp. NPDC056184 TaxID=3345738 RepID=UPI0035E1D08F
MSTTARIGLAEAEALRGCTVTVDIAGSFRGSGFLVAPGLAVTAAHVLLAAAPADPVRVRHASGDHEVAADRIRRAPAQGDSGRFHPFPDLALLPVPGWTGHPVARLAAEEAEPDTVLTALGYSTHTPGRGAQPDTLALRVIGRAADFVGVRGDGIRDGHSGSMLVGADGLVRGVLKGSRSYQRDEGGWFTPVGALAALLGEAGVDVGAQAAVDAAGRPPEPPAAPPSDGELVAALMDFRLLRRSDGRFLLLDAMGRRLGLRYAFEADELPEQRLHLHSIVDGCRSFRDGRVALRALVAALEELAPDDGALDGLRTLVDRSVGGRERV